MEYTIYLFILFIAFRIIYVSIVFISYDIFLEKIFTEITKESHKNGLVYVPNKHQYYSILFPFTYLFFIDIFNFKPVKYIRDRKALISLIYLSYRYGIRDIWQNHLEDITGI